MWPIGASVNGGNPSALPVETELKLSLPKAQARQLWKRPPLSTLLVSKPSHLRLFSAYYDTPRLELRNHDVALRLRRQGRHWTQTVKTAAAPAGGLHQRTELEVAVTRGALDLQWLKHTGLPEFAEGGDSMHALGIVFTTEFDRTVAVVEPVAGTRVEVCVDQGAIVAGTTREPICEVELELKQGRVGPLFELAQQLVDTPDVRIETNSKAHRGYRLVARERPAPAKASSPKLSTKTNVDTVFKTLAFGCIAQMQANEHGVLHSSDIEYVHQARVALRRLRSVFNVFSSTVPETHFSEHLEWLRNISRMLGEARDWDVFVTEFLSEASSSMKEHFAKSELTRNAASLRAEARSRALAALASTDFTVRMLRLSQLLHEQNWDAIRTIEQQQNAVLSPRAFATSVLGRAYRDVALRGKHLDPDNVKGFHKLRIRIKKLRYSSELLSPLFGAKAGRKFLSQLADLQKILGNLNDAANATSLVNRLAAMNDDQAYLQSIAYLRGYAASQARIAVSGFNTVWKKFNAAAPYW